MELTISIKMSEDNEESLNKLRDICLEFEPIKFRVTRITGVNGMFQVILIGQPSVWIWSQNDIQVKFGEHEFPLV